MCNVYNGSKHITYHNRAVFLSALLLPLLFFFFLLSIISPHCILLLLLLCLFLFCSIIIITCMLLCFFGVCADRLWLPIRCPIPPRIVHKTRRGFIRTMSPCHRRAARSHEEISQMNQRKDELKGFTGVLDTHPEISRILSDFMSSILLDKPDDVFLRANATGTFEGENGGIVLSSYLVLRAGKSTLVV